VLNYSPEARAAAIFRRASSQFDRIRYNMGFGVRCVLIGEVEGSMGKSKKKCETVFLVCKEGGDYNYTLKRKPGGEKLSLKKYCPACRKHTDHTEKKK
jgi:large subunit ribosomal protein L33